MDVPVQSIPLLHQLHRKQSRRVEDISRKVALDLKHVRIRGLGMGGRRVGGRGQSVKLYSKCKQKLVVCLAKQTLLFLVSVKLCVLESCICLRRGSSFPLGDVPLELDGWRQGAEPRQHRAGGQGAGRRAPRLPCEETGHCWPGSS